MAESQAGGGGASGGSGSGSRVPGPSSAPHAAPSTSSGATGAGSGTLALPGGGDGNNSSLVEGPTTDFASTLSGGPRDFLSVLICLNLALVYIRKGDIKSCDVSLVVSSPHYQLEFWALQLYRYFLYFSTL